MAVRGNKPVLFSIDHEPAPIEARLAEFKEAINGKSVLFIELPVQFVRQLIELQESNRIYMLGPSYQLLVLVAHKAGLMIVGLDNNKYHGRFWRTVEDNAKPGGTANLDKKSDLFYLNLNKREKDWCRQLAGVGSKAIVVMNPVHAAEIARRLQIPQENILGTLREEPQSRALAEKRAEGIETERLDRRRRRAEQRKRRGPNREP
ncbi:MAG: hypothetical protein HY394_00350 [Candidatus Diapherotrites archaeon]|nr:hypothetical protein [Candidatus Diapherotrites archaeon]